jgi:hypothetical protein
MGYVCVHKLFIYNKKIANTDRVSIFIYLCIVLKAAAELRFSMPSIQHMSQQAGGCARRSLATPASGITALKKESLYT